MKIDIKHLAAYVATAIWADGEYDEAEKISLEEIAEACECDSSTLVEEVEKSLAEIEDKSGEELIEYLLSHSKAVDDEEIEMVFLAALQILTVDGILTVDEVNNLLAIASTLGITDEVAILHLVELVKEDSDLEVKF